MTLAFFAGLIYFAANLYVHSSEWSSMPQNAHLASSTGLEYAGTIKDRRGVVLAQSVRGKRVYNEDEEIRKACLHVVGDNSTNIGTAVQTVFRSELSGYNFVFGLGAPEGMNSGADITLTIDSQVQKAALEALGSNRGAVVVYNYLTGEIICLASTPTYDPENRPEAHILTARFLLHIRRDRPSSSLPHQKLWRTFRGRRICITTARERTLSAARK